MVAGEPQLSLSRLLEIAQIGWRLILAGRHQVAVAAHEIVLLADDDVIVVLGAIILVPAVVRDALISLDPKETFCVDAGIVSPCDD